MSGIYYATTASNVLASTAANYMERFQTAVNQSVERISSGKKINYASDAPSEISYTSRLRSAIMSYKKLNDNLQDNISMFQTADNAITGTSGILSILQSIREKSTEAQNATLTSQDKQNLQQEIEDLINELDDIATSTEFNTRKLLNGEMGAKLSSPSSDLSGYAVDSVDSGSYFFTDITGATQHLFEAATAPNPTASLLGADFDYTNSLGTLGTVTLDGALADAGGSFEIVFDNSSDFKVYNNTSGVVVTSGSVGTEFTLDGIGVTLENDGVYAEDYKINMTTTAGVAAITTDAGNRGLAGGVTLTGTIWGSDTMMNSHFDVRFAFDSGALKYSVFDAEGTQMGAWVASGEEFTAYQSSKLDGSSFTITSADAGIGDIWRIGFGNYTGLQSAGGTIEISSADGGFSISYTGDDQLSDIVAAINENGDGVATATLDESTGSSIIKITAEEYGEAGQLRIYDSAGNFVSTTGLAEDATTGTDASVKYNGQTYESSTGYFYDIADNLVFQVANDADVSSGYVNVTDKTYSQATNINGGDDGISIFIRDLTADGLGLTSGGEYAIDVTTTEGATDAISKVDNIIDTVSGEGTKIGSLINNLSGHVNYLFDTYTEYEINLSLHEDTDYAAETANYYAAVAGRDAAAAMVAQANLMPSRVLALLGVTS